MALGRTFPPPPATAPDAFGACPTCGSPTRTVRGDLAGEPCHDSFHGADSASELVIL